MEENKILQWVTALCLMMAAAVFCLGLWGQQQVLYGVVSTPFSQPQPLPEPVAEPQPLPEPVAEPQSLPEPVAEPKPYSSSRVPPISQEQWDRYYLQLHSAKETCKLLGNDSLWTPEQQQRLEQLEAKLESLQAQLKERLN